MNTALTFAVQTFRRTGIESPMLDARLLMRHALGITHEEMLLQDARVLSRKEEEMFNALVKRRTNREPLSHIIGKREFYGREFKVNRHVLDPRADSETLIEAVLHHTQSTRRQPPITILDLGTGSGCLLLTLLAEIPHATGIGVDVSRDALHVARANAKALGLESRASFTQGHWAGALSGAFDMIISNPPYIPSGKIPQLMPEVAQFEPKLALDGGKDGLDSYREVANHLKHRLAPKGVAALEVGIGQHNAVADILKTAGLEVVEIRQDLAGIPRCIITIF